MRSLSYVVSFSHNLLHLSYACILPGIRRFHQMFISGTPDHVLELARTTFWPYRKKKSVTLPARVTMALLRSFVVPLRPTSVSPWSHCVSLWSHYGFIVVPVCSRRGLIAVSRWDDCLWMIHIQCCWRQTRSPGTWLPAGYFLTLDAMGIFWLIWKSLTSPDEIRRYHHELGECQTDLLSLRYFCDCRAFDRAGWREMMEMLNVGVLWCLLAILVDHFYTLY